MAEYTTVYTRDAGAAEARDREAALGIQCPPNALQADIGTPWLTPPVYDNGEIVVSGVPDPEGGYWSMLAISQAWEGHDATIAAIEAAAVRRFPAHPLRVWT